MNDTVTLHSVKSYKAHAKVYCTFERECGQLNAVLLSTFQVEGYKLHVVFVF